MGTQAETLAAQVQDTADRLVNAIEGCPDADWSRKTSAEGWSIGLEAHHAAASLGATSQLVGAIAKGMPVPPLTAELIESSNAQHAQQFADCTKAETLALARTEGAAAVALVRGLTDEELGRTASLPLAGPQPVSAAQVVAMVVAGHTMGHVESINQSISAAV